MNKSLFAEQLVESDDLEALNTDVFRFLSIIALILAILFSLVQSMPDAQSKKPPQLDNSALLQHDIETLQEQVANLKSALASAKKHQTDQAQLKQRLDEVNSELKTLADKSKSKDAQLSKMRRQLVAQQTKVKKIKAKVVAPSPVKTAKATPKTQPKSTPVAEHKVKPQPKVTAKIKPQEEKVGFSLGFASDHAFLSLFNANQVQLYLLKNSQVWQVSRSSRLIPTNASLNLYHLSANSLPRALISRLSSTSTLSGKNKFAVALPGSVTGQISQWMKKRKGGELVINSAGKVDIF
jgi:flagellar motility protein MotE (MotC chaperone)